MENNIVDMIIVGAGPAGMTAAIYAARAGKKVFIADKNMFGGNISLSPSVENIPGFSNISGSDFAINMFNKMMEYPNNIEYHPLEIKLIQNDHGLYRVFTADNNIILGLSVILAIGTKPRELKLDTKDVYYCVTCDGPKFKNKNVIVVGSGNTGATFALELSNYCKNVSICDVTSDLCCESALKTKILNNKNITWYNNSTILSVKNNRSNDLSSVKLSNGQEIKCSAIFSAIGMVTQASPFSNILNIDENGYICSTGCSANTLNGLFVAGDCRKDSIKQVVCACADGATAAIAASKYIDNI